MSPEMVGICKDAPQSPGRAANRGKSKGISNTEALMHSHSSLMLGNVLSVVRPSQQAFDGVSARPGFCTR